MKGGEKYEGDFRHGVKDGRGRYKNIDGSVYEG